MRKRIWRWLCAVMTGLILLGLASSALADTQLVVRVACGMNAALYLDAAGDPAGIGLPYLRQLAWNNNWKLEYVEGSYNECLQRLYDGEIDLMFPVGDAEDPEGKLAYSSLIGGYQQIGLFAREDADIYYEDFSGFDHKRVGLSIGSNSDILDEYAAQNGFSYEKVSLNTTQDKVDALMRGDVDMIAFSTLNSVPGGKLVAVLRQLPFYFCTTASNKVMIDEINSSMSRLMIVTPDIATDLFQGVLKGETPASLTREEHEKVQTASTIVFGVYGDRLPLAGLDEQGNCVGIYVDLLREIASVSGLNIRVVPVEDSNRLYSAMDDGTVDFVIGLQELRFSQDNADNHLSSNHITECTTTAVTRPDYILGSEDAPRVILTKDRTYLESSIAVWFPDASIQYCDTRRDCLLAVSDGTADVTLLELWEYSYEVKNARFEDLIEWENYHVVSGPTLGGTRQSDLELLSILEKTISKLPIDDVNTIISTNLNRNYTSYTLSDRLYIMRYGLAVGLSLLLVVSVGLTIYIHTKRRYIRQLEIANQTKSDFLSRMSHELRTPLNAVAGYAQIMRSDISDGRASRDSSLRGLSSIENSTEYLLTIINNLLDVHQADAGNVTLAKRSVPFAAYLQETLDMIRPEVEAKHLTLITDVRINKRGSWQMDPVRVRQVLLNLLHNAIKFTPEGGAIYFTAEEQLVDAQTARFRFMVRDTGIGMSKAFMETKLFHSFSQEYSGATSPYEGCGIGLSLSRKLSRLMDGDVTCQSEPGQGSAFTFTFLAAREAHARREHTPSASLPRDLAGLQLLLCEDNPMNQAIEKQLFEKMGCTVDVANDGQIGCELFAGSEPGHYGLIIMDIRMPNMDGLEAARTIRAMDRADAATVLIMALSANASEQDVQASLDAGMNEHLPKPLDVRLIHQKILQYRTAIDCAKRGE